jgi:hypothetical protein
MLHYIYRNTKPAYATEDLKLSVVLVPEASFQREVCGTYTLAQFLDEIRTTNRAGASSYHRSVQIPAGGRSGVYALVRQVSSPVRSACFSNRVLLRSSSASCASGFSPANPDQEARLGSPGKGTKVDLSPLTRWSSSPMQLRRPCLLSH